MRLPTLIVIVTACSLCAGCDQPSEESPRASNGQPREADLKSAASRLSAIAISQNFPRDVPLFPSMHVKFTQVQSTPDGKRFILQSFSTESLETLSQYFDSQLKAKGWEQLPSTTASDTFHQWDSRKEGKQLELKVMAMPSGQNEITVSVFVPSR